MTEHAPFQVINGTQHQSSLEPDFDWLIAPASKTEFMEEHWEKAPFLARAPEGQRSRFADHLPPDDLNTVLTSYGLSHPDISMADASRDLTAEDYSFSNGRIDPVRAYQEHQKGASLIFNQLQIMHPGMARLTHAMEATLNHSFQTNIYWTPSNAQGFKTHYDNHDVFVLQVSGSKEWKLYDTAIPLPLRSQAFVPGQMEFGPVSSEFVLEEGDMLYLPRGLVHDARSTGDPSIHITLGLLSRTWLEVIQESIAQLALEDVALRKSVTPGFAMDRSKRQEAAQELKRLIGGLAGKIDAPSEIDKTAHHFIANRVPVAHDQPAQLAGLETLQADTPMQLRPHAMVLIDTDPETIRVHAYGRTVAFPDSAEPELRAVMTGEVFTANDLPGDLDEVGRLTLIRRLVQEGLVVRDPATPSRQTVKPALVQST
jgi:ribosomal protein L16 Arg81 hydroxylase